MLHHNPDLYKGCGANYCKADHLSRLQLKYWHLYWLHELTSLALQRWCSPYPPTVLQCKFVCVGNISCFISLHCVKPSWPYFTQYLMQHIIYIWRKILPFLNQVFTSWSSLLGSSNSWNKFPLFHHGLEIATLCIFETASEWVSKACCLANFSRAFF